jgi:ferric-dicitrate binding protein FerR (iron transport regulator)
MSDRDECSHWPDVEAAADGRFGSRDVERVERHLATCASCQARQARWEALREEARAHAAAPVTELERHRARASLLRAAAVGGERRVSRGQGLMLAAGVAAAAAVALVLARGGARTMTPPTEPAHAQAHVEPTGAAQWTRTVEPARETIRLTDGALQVTVPHQHARHRFVVSLPDGEIEVRGTRFVVEARRGRTERVTVFEGLVALRLGASSERLLAAGERWEVGGVAAPTVATAVAGAPATEPTPSIVAAARPSSTSRPSSHHAPPAEEGGFQRFAAGVAAMGRGDFRVAAESFASFEQQRSDDERAEDAGWLRVVALRRGGDDAASLAAAERYLARYASGAHRGEAASLLARSAYVRGDCARVVALATAEGGRAGASDLARLRSLCQRDAGDR